MKTVELTDEEWDFIVKSLSDARDELYSVTEYTSADSLNNSLRILISSQATNQQ